MLDLFNTKLLLKGQILSIVYIITRIIVHYSCKSGILVLAYVCLNLSLKTKVFTCEEVYYFDHLVFLQ